MDDEKSSKFDGCDGGGTSNGELNYGKFECCAIKIRGGKEYLDSSNWKRSRWMSGKKFIIKTHCFQNICPKISIFIIIIPQRTL